MKTRRNALIVSLAIAAALALPASGAQAQRFGRDSVYAVPGQTVATRNSTWQDGFGTRIVANADVTRYGRDSVYATQAPATGKTSGVTTVRLDVTHYGRDSVYATQAPATGSTIGVTTVGADVTFKPGRP